MRRLAASRKRALLWLVIESKERRSLSTDEPADGPTRHKPTFFLLHRNGLSWSEAAITLGRSKDTFADIERALRASHKRTSVQLTGMAGVVSLVVTKQSHWTWPLYIPSATLFAPTRLAGQRRLPQARSGRASRRSVMNPVSVKVPTKEIKALTASSGSRPGWRRMASPRVAAVPSCHHGPVTATLRSDGVRKRPASSSKPVTSIKPASCCSAGASR